VDVPKLISPGLTSRAVAYLKALLPPGDGSPTTTLSPEKISPVFRPFAPGLIFGYLVDLGEYYEYVQQRHLEQDGIDEARLHQIGLANLGGLVNTRQTRVQPYGNIFAVLMGGDFEASLLALDMLWEVPFRQFVRGDYAAAVPARDLLAFCDASSEAGLDELRALIARSSGKVDHALSDRLYVRRDGAWSVLAS
jgi:hypothetical protein